MLAIVAWNARADVWRVDVEGSSKEELYERAKKLGVQGRSQMSKRELADADARKQ